MAWKIATASGLRQAEERPGRPFTFLQAAGFQWVNPKGWVVAVGAISAFTTVQGDLFFEVGAITLIFACVNYPCASAWTLFGVGIGRLLQRGNRLLAFNGAMALLLVALHRAPLRRLTYECSESRRPSDLLAFLPLARTNVVHADVIRHFPSRPKSSARTVATPRRLFVRTTAKPGTYTP